MKDPVIPPEPLTTSSEASPLERSLLLAGRALREPAGMRDRAWAAIGVGISAGGAAGGAATAGTASAVKSGAPAAMSAGAGTTSKAASAGLALAKAKLLVMGVVLVAGAGTGTYMATRGASRTRTRPTVQIAMPTPSSLPIASAAPMSSSRPGPEARLEVPPSASAPNLVTHLAAADPPPRPTVQAEARTERKHAPGPPPSDTAKPNLGNPPSALAEEAALLREAQNALDRGDVTTATRRLDDVRTRFPAGTLAEERQAIEVRAAFAAGDRARGIALARAFAEQHPRSPLRRGIEALAAP